jgi:hypothetical protein
MLLERNVQITFTVLITLAFMRGFDLKLLVTDKLKKIRHPYK